MKNSNNRSLLEETKREAAKIEAEIAKHPELDDLEVTDAMDDALFQKIRAYEDGVEHSTEETVPSREEETEKTIPYRKRKRKKKIYIGLVAVLVMIIGLGVSSIGSKSYLKEVWDKSAGNEDVTMTNVEDMEVKEIEDGEEIAVYKEIYNQLGINVPKLIYKPKDMILKEYEIDKEMQSAILFFDYQGNIIRYFVYLNDKNSSWGAKKEDIKIDLYTILVDNTEVIIEVYEKENTSEYRMEASFGYKGVEYRIKGVMEKEEFNKMIKNMYFFEK